MKEFQVRYRFLDINGQPTTLRFRFFRTARDAHQFLVQLDSLDSRQAVSVTIATREIQPWDFIDRLDLERLAAEEGGG